MADLAISIDSDAEVPLVNTIASVRVSDYLQLPVPACPTTASQKRCVILTKLFGARVKLSKSPGGIQRATKSARELADPKGPHLRSPNSFTVAGFRCKAGCCSLEDYLTEHQYE